MDFKSGIKLTLESPKTDGTPWLFLPGGPGMGSESLKDLIFALDIDTPMYRVDLPDDGGNRVGKPITLDRWQQAILEVSRHFEEVVWVGHSFGGMLLQTIPALEQYTAAIALLNTAPDNTWFKTFAQRSKQSKLPNISELRKNFIANPNDDSYKAFMLNGIDYYFTPQGVTQGIRLFQSLPFNHQAYLWAMQYFHPVYTNSWVPNIPTLLLTSSDDHMTPPDAFDSEDYQQSNFMHANINHAGHFPWIEQPELVASSFNTFKDKNGA